MLRKVLWLLFPVLIIAFCLNGCSGSGKDDGSKNVTTELIKNPVMANGNGDTSLLPRFQFIKTKHDFGVVIEGEKVSYTYRFKNSGKSDLIISAAKGSCGCTVPKYSTNPVPPGKEGDIEVIFDSSGRSGIQNKTVTVLANTQPNKIELSFSAEVVVPEEK